MKIKLAAHLSLLIGLVSMNMVGTACGAAPADASSTPSFTMTGTTPELDKADERVRQADAQLGVARKQLKASQQLLRAAEADLRAAKAAREALALQTQAQSMADEAGMTPSTAPPVGPSAKSIAVAPTVTKKVEKTEPVVTTTPAPSDAPTMLNTTSGTTPVNTESAELKPMHNVDFNAEPLNADEATTATPPVMLR
jgi:hypothetical protein